MADGEADVDKKMALRKLFRALQNVRQRGWRGGGEGRKGGQRALQSAGLGKRTRRKVQ